MSGPNTPPQPPPPTYASSSTQMYGNEVVMQAPSSFENVHPHLVNKLQTFSHHLIAQPFEDGAYHNQVPYDTPQVPQVPQTHYQNHPSQSHPSQSHLSQSHSNHPVHPSHETHHVHPSYQTHPSQPNHPTQAWTDMSVPPRTHEQVSVPQQHHQPHVHQPPVPAQAPPAVYYYDHNAQMSGPDPNVAHGYKPQDHDQMAAISMSDTWVAFMGGVGIPAPHPHAKR